MSDQPKAQDGFRMATPFVSLNLVEVLQVPMQVVLDEQAEVLDKTGTMTAAWMKRRQEDMEADMQIFGAMLGCRDPGTMVVIYSEWLTGSVNRLMADLNEARDEGVPLAEIGQRSVMALFRQGADAAATEKPKPSAPSRESGRAKGASRSEFAAETRRRSAAE